MEWTRDSRRYVIQGAREMYVDDEIDGGHADDDDSNSKYGGLMNWHRD